MGKCSSGWLRNRQPRRPITRIGDPDGLAGACRGLCQRQPRQLGSVVLSTEVRSHQGVKPGVLHRLHNVGGSLVRQMAMQPTYPLLEKSGVR